VDRSFGSPGFAVRGGGLASGARECDHDFEPLCSSIESRGPLRSSEGGLGPRMSYPAIPDPDQSPARKPICNEKAARCPGERPYRFDAWLSCAGSSELAPEVGISDTSESNG